MTDAYLPPRQDFDEPPAPGSATWTIRSVLRGMRATMRRQPFTAIVTIFVLPILWSVPAQWMQDRIVPKNAAELGPDQPLLWMLVTWIAIAWNTLLTPGSQLAALRAAAGEAIRWADFVTGLRKVPALLLIALCAGMPFELVERVRLPTPFAELGLVSVLFGTMIFMARTFLWGPLLLLTSRSFFEAFEMSWAATRGQTLRLLGLILALIAIATPFVLVDASVVPSCVPLTFGVIGGLLVLATAQIYVVLAPHSDGVRR